LEHDSVAEREKDRNPWLSIPARDYEGHMGPKGVDQLGALDRILSEIYAEVRPASMVVLGCGTGNGFKHIDPAVTTRVVGVDINSAYLEIARQRYPQLKDVFEACCFYAEKCAFDPESFDLVHSALVLEYLDPEPMIEKIASWLAPGGTASFVIQEPGSENGPVSPSAFTSLMSLAGAMRLLSPEVLGRLAKRHGLRETKVWKVPLKRGKTFHAARYVKD
jgi:SAM-dependent methyltransferase